ncbi:MAG: ATP-binding cassette domain-containing protein, partial [bacterium]
PGEVLGLAGLKGSGRTEILNNLFGIEKIEEGDIKINGNSVNINSPNEAIENKLFLVPENRHTQGLSLDHTIYFNMLLPLLDELEDKFIDDKRGKEIVNNYINLLDIKTDTLNSKANELSGGNQQKVVISKSLAVEPEILLMDDPTYGVDIHTKKEIMNLLNDLAREQKKGILLVSSEMKELVSNCDRILIIKDKKIVKEVDNVFKTDYTLESLTSDIQ